MAGVAAGHEARALAAPICPVSQSDERHIQQAERAPSDGGAKWPLRENGPGTARDGPAAQRIGASPAPKAVKMRVVTPFMLADTSGKSPTGW